MLGQSTIHEILARALRTLPGDVSGQKLEADAYMLAHDSALTRFANNTIHQNVAETDVAIGVRVILGKRSGMATTNDASPEALERAAQSALTFARFRPENPDFKGLPEPQDVPEIRAYDEATAACTPEYRAIAVGEVCARAAERGLTAAGAFQTATIEQAYASTRGAHAYQAGTQADFQTVVMGTDSSGWAHESGWRMGALDVSALGDEAIGTAERGRNPREVQAGTYPVVLAPYAVQDILGMLMMGASAQSVQEQRSWMSGRQGQALVSPSISVWDDGRELCGYPMAFDGEGVPKQHVDIIKTGVVGDPVYDTMSAGREEGKHSTGHAIPSLQPQAASMGPLPLNLFMGTGNATLEEMIAATKQGVLVTRFWYTRVVHPRDVTITGLTRDGTFWIENGAIAFPIYNLRFTQAYIKALAGTRMVGRERRSDSDWGSATAPALALDAFTFTGVSPKG